jgi:hypothetical protein
LFRAVSEIAATIHAPFIIYLAEGYTRNGPNNERDGREVIIADVILPDGSIAISARGLYQEVNSKMTTVEPIQLSDENENKQAKQNMVPSWGAVDATWSTWAADVTPISGTEAA